MGRPVGRSGGQGPLTCHAMTWFLVPACGLTVIGQRAGPMAGPASGGS